MNQLIAYLRENMILDFQGDLSIEMVREFLKNDETRESRQLLRKLVDEGGVDDMFLVLADCLLEQVQLSIGEGVFREQLRNYSES